MGAIAPCASTRQGTDFFNTIGREQKSAFVQ
jgi:hypothetical protein